MVSKRAQVRALLSKSKKFQFTQKKLAERLTNFSMKFVNPVFIYFVFNPQFMHKAMALVEL